MVIESPDDVIAALARDPALLIDVPESVWLDFKGEPYWIPPDASARRKFELAKDVTAMANSGGGIIVIGVRTELVPETQEEIAKEIRPIDPGLVQKKQIEDVIEEWCVPRPGVRIRDYPYGSAAAKKRLWSIRVDAGIHRDMPYLVAKEFRDEDGKEAHRNLFGLYERIGTTNRGRDSALVHQWIRVGYREKGSIFERTSSAFKSDVGADVKAEEGQAERTRLRDIAHHDLGPNDSYLVIQFLPRGGSRLTNFNEGDPDSVYDSLQRIEQLRPRGFHLPAEAPVEPAEEGGYRISIPGKSSLSVLPSGITTAVMCEGLMTWAHQRYSPKDASGQYEAVYANPLAIHEFALEAARFFLGTIVPRARFAVEWDWRVGMEGVRRGIPLAMPRVPFGTLGVSHSTDTGEDFIEPWTRGEATDAGSLSYLIVLSIYRHFRLGEGYVLYREEGARRISEDQIRRIR